MGGVGARPIWAPPVFPRNGTGDGGRDARRSSTVRTSADMPLGGISTHVLRCGRVRGELYTRVDRSRAAACDLRCYLRSNREERKAALSKTNVDSPGRRERVPFQPGGSNKSIERGQLFLEYVGVNREIDRENGIFEKLKKEIDTLPAGPIASRHTGHARPTSLVFPPSVTCSTNSTTHQASFVQSRGGSPRRAPLLDETRQCTSVQRPCTSPRREDP